MKSNFLFSPNKQGMTLSIGLHLLLLGLAYCKRSPGISNLSNRQAYRIALQPTHLYTRASDQCAQGQRDEERQPMDELKNKNLKLTNNSLKKSSFLPKRTDQKQPNSLKTKAKIAQLPKASTIDKRGLYKTSKNGIKQTGATLELSGWEWDVMPNPNDTTEECGKIVFEIKVDNNGEIISIQTIEKTLTPIVEKIYADALRSLTFSKTVEDPSNISTGKVTFILVAK